jgi:hypothetical protein
MADNSSSTDVTNSQENNRIVKALNMARSNHQEHIQILERAAEFQVWENYTSLHSTATEANCQPIPSKTKKAAAGAKIQSLAAELRLVVHK